MSEPTIQQKLREMLNPEQRRGAIVLLVLMFVGMILETLGVGLIIPAMALMTQGDLASRYPELRPWLESVGNPNQAQLIVVGMLTLVGVYAVKNLFLAYLTWKQARFVSSLQVEFSQRLFVGYLLQPYTFHLQRNSAQLIRNTIHHSGAVAGVIQKNFILIAEVLVLLGITFLLLKVEPVGAIVMMGVLGFAGWGFNRVSRNYIFRWGKAYQYHEGLRIQHLQQGLGSAKDVKLLGREDDFLNSFRKHTVVSANANQRQTTLQALPRLWLELLAVCGLATLVLVMLWQGKTMDALVPTLGLFAAAAFRLMPSISRILGAVQGVRFSLPVINTLYSELRLLGDERPRHTKGPLVLKGALVLEEICFQYSSAATPAITGVSMKIPKGAAVGFIGGSGAGKSTLVDVILGLLTPTQGCVKIDGVDIQTNLRGWQDQIGYVPQSIYLTDDTLRRNVAFGLPADQIDEAAVLRAIHAAQLGKFVSELPQGLNTLVGERGIRLSGGQRQRIGIARALYHDPHVIVLDEATSSLDTATESGVMDAVRALKGDKTLLVVAHRLSTVAQCDYLYRLEHGQVIEEGSAAKVLGYQTI